VQCFYVRDILEPEKLTDTNDYLVLEKLRNRVSGQKKDTAGIREGEIYHLKFMLRKNE
jgi:hypothetical protein